MGGTTTRQVSNQADGLPLLAADGSASYLTGHGGPFARIDAAGTTTYLHTDQLGSVRLLTNAAGSVLATRTYDAYGKTVVSTGSFDTPLATPASTPTPSQGWFTCGPGTTTRRLGS